MRPANGWDGMGEAGRGGAKPAWAPRSWGAEPEGAEKLDVDPRELARRIRAHRARSGEGLIDFDEPADVPAGGTGMTLPIASAKTPSQIAGGPGTPRDD
ncbi:MAG TPA: hypothetical protein VII47_06750 [Actinomycetota bacterium]|jgi:hypothetical protein